MLFFIGSDFNEMVENFKQKDTPANGCFARNSKGKKEKNL